MTDEEVVQTDQVLGVRTRGASYFSLALNQHGVAFASTAVNSVRWTKAVYSNQNLEANAIAKIDNQGLTSPTEFLSSLFSNLKAAKAFPKMLSEAGQLWRGYHIAIVDQNDALVLETYRDQVRVRELVSQDAITNHFQKIDYGPKIAADYPDSFERLAYVQPRIQEVSTLNEFKNIIHPKDEGAQKTIWRKAYFKTVSSSILDFKKFCLLYTKDLRGDYQEFFLRSQASEVKYG